LHAGADAAADSAAHAAADSAADGIWSLHAASCAFVFNAV